MGDGGTKRGRLATCIVALVVGATACSHGGSAQLASGVGVGVATTEAASTTVPPPSVDQDRATAQHFVLTAADVPSLDASATTS